MANQDKCPKCGKRVLHVNVETMIGMLDTESKGRCMSYSCNHCNAVLGLQIDHRTKPRSRTRPVAKA